jgi:hypothetical protein
MKSIAATILREFEGLGVKLDPASRLAKQINVYLDPKGTLPQIIDPAHPLLKTAVEAHRDLNQVAFALTQLLPVVPRDEMKKQLRRLVVDNVLPQDNPERSPGRDAQCELFVAALCVRARLDPVFDESPDLRCKLANQVFGVAIKRIKAPPERFVDRFKERMREAAEQVAKSQLPGIIVTDISQSLNPTNWWVPIEFSDSKFDYAWSVEMTQLKGKFEKPLLDWTRGKNVRGVILIDHILRCPPTGAWRMELRCSSISLCPFNQRRRREFELFETQFARAISDPGSLKRP